MAPKNVLLFVILAFFFLSNSNASREHSRTNKGTLPTLYEYYTSGGIKSGLEANHPDHFVLNGKPFIIYSGSFHYFRVVPQHWPSILQRFKAAGLNAVQLYLPWNLHEETPGHFDFQSPGINLSHFLEEIKRADMFAIIRPGPYICAEWEMGGFPSWLLRDPKMQFRTMNQPFLDRVKLYWKEAFQIINQYQFSSGGPVIMLSVENEYFGAPQNHSLVYLEYLKNFTRQSGFTQLLFTSDPVEFAKTNPIKSIPDLLETANLNENAFTELMAMRAAQPNRPIYVSEFWPGWFDSWGDKSHHQYDLDKFDKEVGDILFKVNGSINFYMFIGGTNFGFWNGARVVTSYDYGAALSEAGNYTDKYFETRALYDRLVSEGRHPKIALPDDPPEVADAQSYGNVSIVDWIPLEVLLRECNKFENVPKPVTMEMLDSGPGYGQRVGFILYRVETKPIARYEITGPIADRAIFLIDGNQTSIIEDGSANFSIQIDPRKLNSGQKTHNFDVLVENQGRENWGILETQLKGISSDIKLDGVIWNNFTIFSLDFNQSYVDRVNALDYWIPFDAKLNFTGPVLYRTNLKIASEPQDTYLLLSGWTKGNVFVNSFNIGRYWSKGPQKTLYIPGPLLKSGDNCILIFELHSPGAAPQFIDGPILEVKPKKQRKLSKSNFHNQISKSHFFL